MKPRLAALLGYDPHRVADLRPELQRALAMVALAAFPGIALLAGSAAYGTFLASDALGLSIAVGIGAGLYLLNLLRVAVAGGGVGPQQPLAEVTQWMPRTVPRRETEQLPCASRSGWPTASASGSKRYHSRNAPRSSRCCVVVTA